MAKLMRKRRMTRCDPSALCCHHGHGKSPDPFERRAPAAAANGRRAGEVGPMAGGAQQRDPTCAVP